MSETLSKSDQKLAVFVAEYLIDRNGTRAATAAGYSKKSAHVTASRLLRNPKVIGMIEAETSKRLDRLEITADRILQEAAKLAFFDPRNLFNQDGTPKHITELDANTAACVAGLEVEELYEGRGEARAKVGIVHRIKLVDKRASVELLGRNHKLWTDRMELDDLSGLTPEQRKEKALQLVRDSLARGEQ
jgi:phage terminase small subunit